MRGKSRQGRHGLSTADSALATERIRVVIPTRLGSAHLDCAWQGAAGRGL